MPARRDDAVYIWDMLHAAEGVAETVRARSSEKFVADENVRLATERRLEIIGEAASHVSMELRGRYPGIPWRSIIGLRNIIVHNYSEVDALKIWKISVERVSELVPHLRRILIDLGPPPELPSG